MDDLLNLFAILLMFCICCGVPVAVAGIAAYAFGVETPRKKEALKQFADQMGLTPVADPRRGQRYAGVHQEHAFDIGFGVARKDRLGPDRIHHSYALALQVVVEVPANDLLRGYAGCNRYPGPQESFKSAFGKARMGMEQLSPEACAAMMAFVRKHGYLWFKGLPLHVKPATPAPRMQLEHTLSGATPERVRAVLDEMVEVARVIETTCLVPPTDAPPAGA
jgi:hypothetical protein